MASSISNKEQIAKCERFILGDTSRTDKKKLIQDALITSNREISDLGQKPLPWNTEIYDEEFTKFHAQISDMTNADPGVITASSLDPNTGEFPYIFGFSLSGHLYDTDDIVYIEGVNGENSLSKINHRLYRVVEIDGDTLSLKALDGQREIDTTGYQVYSDGGYIYHAGIVLPTSDIEPSGGVAAVSWKIKRVYSLEIDGYPCHPITEGEAVEKRYIATGARPKRWRYQQYSYTNFSSPTHMLFWYPFTAQRYNLKIMIEKEYPDLATWSASTYPPHPAHIHDFIWHRALANLATHAEKQRRRSAGKKGETGDNTKIEILHANYWIQKKFEEEQKILEYSRSLEGDQPYMSQGMSA